MGLRHTNQAKSFFSGRRGNSGPLNLFHRFVNVCQECQAELEKAKAAAEQKAVGGLGLDALRNEMDISGSEDTTFCIVGTSRQRHAEGDEAYASYATYVYIG